MYKILKYIGVAAIIAFTATSCTKSWLDVNPSNIIEAEDQFSREEGFQDALIGAYLTMGKQESYGQQLTYNLIDLLAKHYTALTTNSYLYTTSLYDYSNIRSHDGIEKIWNTSYNVIVNVNAALSYIDQNKSVLNTASYNIIKGELLGLRAFLHFDIMRVFGHSNYANRPELAAKLAIPYITSFTKQITPQRSYTETFRLMDQDIQDAIELLQYDPAYKSTKITPEQLAEINKDNFLNNRENRLNYYAVKGLQARVKLWQGGAANLAIAKAAAKEVIDDSPAALISAATPIGDKLFVSEHLFGLKVVNLNTYASTLFRAQATATPNALYLTTAMANNLFETSVSEIGLVDRRYLALLETQNIGKVPSKYFNFATLGAVGTMPLMRISEMYYILAEATAATDLPAAVELLNVVRRSRGIELDIASNATQTIFEGELQKEYRKDFLAEGQLFFFYKRLGKTAFPNLATTIIANDAIYMLPYPADEVDRGNRVQ